LGRLRVGGALLELHSDELCFSAVETGAVVAANGVPLDSQQVERLHALTEGWPAGVQLAALALQRDTTSSRFLDAFASSDRAVADFLVGEVLDRQPAELVEFLYATSVLDGFDAALCEAVTGRDDAAALLARVVAANLFVVRLDVGAGWYRYHHLFRAFLQVRLRALGNARWRATHERAAQAFEARDDIVNALHHATVSGGDEEAAAIIRRTLVRWITAIDPDVTGAVVRQWLYQHRRAQTIADPVQVIECILPLVATTPADDAPFWLNEIAAAHPDAPPALTALMQGLWAEHHLYRGEADEATSRAQLAMDAVGGAPPPEGLLPVLPVVLARAHIQANELAAAAAVLGAAEARRTGHPVVDGVRVPALQAWVAFLNGELRRAEQRAGAAIACADELKLPSGELGRIFAGLSMAGLHIERKDDVAAGQLLDELRHEADLGRRPPVQSLVALQHARYARIVGDEAAAAADLTLARLLLPTASRSVESMFDVEAVEQAIHFRPSSAADLIDALGDRSSATLLGIRLALFEGDRRRATALLDVLPPARTPRERVVRGVLVALTLVHADLEAANRELTDALLVAHLEGLRRTILDQGLDVLNLLVSFTPTAALEGYVGELIEAASSAVAPIRQPPMTSLVDPLSEREVTVLRYLCSRLTYQEIASALYVSHNTLKSHVSSVYRKLAVGSRREAVEAGRQLRIV
jgi:LuxR family maltose regulon positive regulatory protein